MIEYSGELIRPSVADAREQQMYDRLVGAGTYIFRMNDETCVDATRAGIFLFLLFCLWWTAVQFFTQFLCIVDMVVLKIH